MQKNLRTHDKIQPQMQRLHININNKLKTFNNYLASTQRRCIFGSCYDSTNDSDITSFLTFRIPFVFENVRVPLSTKQQKNYSSNCF